MKNECFRFAAVDWVGVGVMPVRLTFCEKRCVVKRIEPLQIRTSLALDQESAIISSYSRGFPFQTLVGIRLDSVASMFSTSLKILFIRLSYCFIDAECSDMKRAPLKSRPPVGDEEVERVTLSIGAGDKRELERIAQEKRVSTAWVIRDAISQYLEGKEKTEG